MGIPFRTRTVDLGLPASASHAYGTFLVGVPERRTFFFTFVEKPSAYRFARYEIQPSRLQVIKGVRGELRGGAFDARRNVLHALTSLGLFEIGIDPLAVRRSASAGTPKDAHALTASEDRSLLAVQRTTVDPSPIVSAETYVVTATLRGAAVDAAFVLRGEQRLFSFCRGLSRAIDPDGRLKGSNRPAPEMNSALVGKEHVFGIALWDETASAEAHAERDTLLWRLVKVERASLEAVASCEAEEFEDLLGFDAEGNVVAVTKSEVVLVDPGTMKVVARKETGHTLCETLYSCALAGPSTVVALLEPRSSRSVLLVEWGADARVVVAP